MTARSAVLALIALSALSACGKGDRDDRAVQDTAAADGMPHMPGMARMNSGTMMADMQAHMRTIQGAGPDSLVAMLSTHRQVVANALAQMNREMREMNMPGDAAWNATMDSLRQDLRTMPDLSGEELARMMPSHGVRVMRLLEMHRSMMQDM